MQVAKYWRNKRLRYRLLRNAAHSHTAPAAGQFKPLKNLGKRAKLKKAIAERAAS